MSTLDIKADARKAFDIMKNGGIAILPNDTGYALASGTKEGILKIFNTKQRGGHKRNVLLGDRATEREFHILDQRGREMVEAITQDYDLPLGVIARFNHDHPLLQKLDADLKEASSANDTMAMLMNAGPMYEEVGRLSREEVHPILGSSANLTGTGTRFSVQEMQPEITGIADVIIDYGPRKYKIYKRAGTLINFNTMEVIRIGICYEQIAFVLRRHFNVELPPDPGVDALPSGHLNEFALKRLE